MFANYVLLNLAALTNILGTPNCSREIKKDTFKSFQITGTWPANLNLSNLRLSAVHVNSFANSSNLKTLNLSKNCLKELPALTNPLSLESLDLANNNITSGKFYVGLINLQTLNLSNNPLKIFEPGHFFGLTKSVNILTKGLHLSSITAAMFENPVTVRNRLPFAKEEENEIDEKNTTNLSSPENDNEIEVCIQDGRLMSVKNFNNSKSLPEGCRKVHLNSGTLSLNDMGIRTFENGWYRLRDENVTSIYLSDNEIAQFTKELLNDLPAGILKVSLSRNKIERLGKGIIENKNNIDVLDLRYNFISELEDGALEKLNLTEWLLLDDNLLENTKFLDSLPPYIQHVSLDRNKITEISTGNFINFRQFKTLSLASNDIEEIKVDSLCNFSSLTELLLPKNRLLNVETGAFQHLKNLVMLDLTGNELSSIEKDMFSGLKNIRHISLDTNEIEDTLYELLAKMPNSLETLWLGRNKIKSCRAPKLTYLCEVMNGASSGWDAFWQVVNSISIPNLEVLDLHDNLLMNIEGFLFEEFKNLSVLSLAANKIEVIKKGFARALSNLYSLDLSDNPIKELKNGALFGLSKDSETVIHVNRVPLELIQGGLFDDV